MKKKNVIFSAVLSIALCAALLAGSTFAYFTASSKVNIAVTSGKVDVVATADGLKLWSLESIDPSSLTGTEVERTNDGTFINGGTAAMDGRDLKLNDITAGDRVSFNITIKNNSNINVKYRVVVSASYDEGLFNELEMSFSEYKGKFISVWKNLAPGSEVETLDCSVGLPAESTVQGKSCTVMFTVEAVQSNMAVQDGVLAPIDVASLKTALSYGGEVEIARDMELEAIVEDKNYSGLVEQTTITNDTILNLNGKTIAVEHDETTDFGKASPVLMSVTGGTLTINGNGDINCEAGNQQVYGINVFGGSVVINGGNYYGAMTAVQVQKGSLEINGGFFDMAPTCKSAVPQYAKYVVNCIDRAYKNGTASISVKGGTFVNFDPSANPEGENTSYVAEGYSVVSETKANGDVWYTVVKGEGVVASTQEEMNDFIKNTEGAATVKLAEGEYTLPALNDKDLTVVGTKDTVIDMVNKVNNANSVAFEGVTVNFGSESYKGFQHTNSVVYKNCVINGFMTTYGDTTFENCTFTSGSGKYAINFYGGKDFTLTNCHFYGVDKNVYIYQETVDSDKNITFNNCDFHMSATDTTKNKSAIMLNSAAYTFNGFKYNVTINNCTAEGVNITAAENVAGNTNYQGLYGLKHSPFVVEGTVTVNGTVVYNK